MGASSCGLISYVLVASWISWKRDYFSSCSIISLEPCSQCLLYVEACCLSTCITAARGFTSTCSLKYLPAWTLSVLVGFRWLTLILLSLAGRILEEVSWDQELSKATGCWVDFQHGFVPILSLIRIPSNEHHQFEMLCLAYILMLETKSQEGL